MAGFLQVIRIYKGALNLIRMVATLTNLATVRVRKGNPKKGAAWWSG